MSSFAVAAVRAAVVDMISADPQMAEVAVGLEPPAGHYVTETAGGLQVDTADNPAAVWLGGDFDGVLAVLALKPHGFEETWPLSIICQVLPETDDDDLATAEAQVAGIVARILDLVVADSSLGVPMLTAQVVATAEGFTWHAGSFGPGSAARCEVHLNINVPRC